MFLRGIYRYFLNGFLTWKHHFWIQPLKNSIFPQEVAVFWKHTRFANGHGHEYEADIVHKCE